MTYLTYRGVSYVKPQKKFYVTPFSSFEENASDSKKNQKALV